MTTLLARELERQGVSVTELANASGIDRKYLYALKDGYRKNPSWHYVSRIAAALRVPPTKIFPLYGRT